MYIHQQLERQSQRPSIDHDCNKYYVCHCNISFVLDGHLKIKENNKYKKGKMMQEGLKKKRQKKNPPSSSVFPCDSLENKRPRTTLQKKEEEKSQTY